MVRKQLQEKWRGPDKPSGGPATQKKASDQFRVELWEVPAAALLKGLAKPAPPANGANFITLADQVRRWGMLLLLWAFVGTAATSLAAVVFANSRETERFLQAAAAQDPGLAVALAERPFDHLKQILQILLPAQTALLGSAMGFYYGSQAKGTGGR